MVDCSNFTKNASAAAAFDIISNECAQFDFFVYSVVVGTFCLLGLVGNVISFVLLLRDATSSGGAAGATALILGALAVADALVLVAAIPLYVLSNVHQYTGWLGGYQEVYMGIMPYLWPVYQIPYTATVFLTVLVSLNRYEAVCRPFSATKLWGGDKVRRHVAYIAAFSVLYNIPRFFEYHEVELCTGPSESRRMFELSAFGNNKVYRVLYANVLYFVVMHGGPLLSLAFLNANLIRALKLQAKRRAEMKMAGYQQDITLVLVVVVFVFICCQTPTFIDHILWTVLDRDLRVCGSWHYYYTALGDMMAIANSSVNFVIYVLTSPHFRQSLGAMCWGVIPGGCAGRLGLLRHTPGGHEAMRGGRTETIMLCSTRGEGVATAVKGGVSGAGSEGEIANHCGAQNV